MINVKKLILPFLLLLSFPAVAQQVCGLQQLIIEPSPARYGEEIDVRMRGACSSGAGLFNPRVTANGTTITIELANPGGATLAPIRWGERVVLGRLLPGTYDVVVRTAQHELGRQRIEVQPQPFALAPAIGTAGDQLVLSGVHLLDCPSLPCQAIRFGGVPATVTSDDRNLIVTVPPHAPGVVDVTLHESTGVIALPGGFRYGSRNDADFERVLFPVNFSSAGANGSEWHTEIVVRNNAPVPVHTEPATFVYPPPPFPPISTALDAGAKGVVPPGSTDGGMFFYVPRGLESWLAYSSHFFDRSRSTSDRGAELPVVRARDTAAVLHLPDVPLDPLFRARLRIYDFDAVDGRWVEITATADDGTVHTLHTLLHAELVVCVTTPCFQPRPAFASVDLSSIGSLRQKRIADVLIATHERDARLWAFITVTNNETQHVTVHTPQHARP